MSRLFLLFKSVQSCDPEFLTSMYYTYVVPILDYCSPIFNSNSKQNSAVIERVQKHFTRLVFNRCYKYVHPVIPDYTACLKVLFIESLSDRRLKSDLILFHKLVNNILAIETNTPPFCDFYSTRNNPRGIIIPKSTKNIRNEFFTVRIPKLYTKLPPEIVQLPPHSFADLVKRTEVSKLFKL